LRAVARGVAAPSVEPFWAAAAGVELLAVVARARAMGDAVAMTRRRGRDAARMAYMIKG
jgi:hypothetical protein